MAPSAIQVDGDVHANGDARNFIKTLKQEVTDKYGLPDKTGNFLTEEDKNAIGLGHNIDNYPPDKPYSICLRDFPITAERRPFIPKAGDKLIDAGTARSNVAASKEAPNGTTQGDWNKKHAHETPLQQHVLYFDTDGDGVIWPSDTYRGFRAWGWSIPLCLFAVYVINVGLSYPTLPSWIPDPAFRIYIANLHKDKHGSDSGSYDTEGRFRPQNFEDLFAKYDRGHKGGLDMHDIFRLWKGQRMAFDFFGWTASFLEWVAVYLLCWPEDGVVRKEDIRRIFDGSIFQYKADEHAMKVQREKNHAE